MPLLQEITSCNSTQYAKSNQKNFEPPKKRAGFCVDWQLLPLVSSIAETEGFAKCLKRGRDVPRAGEATLSRGEDGLGASITSLANWLNFTTFWGLHI